jgi:hypothetical protein
VKHTYDTDRTKQKCHGTIVSTGMRHYPAGMGRWVVTGGKQIVSTHVKALANNYIPMADDFCSTLTLGAQWQTMV